MLSYQHIYHAGNAADVHKHLILSHILFKIIKKNKPVTYIETHAGRGLYDLSSPESQKTNEAKSGILNITAPESDPYFGIIKQVRETYGDHFYPGSPLIADMILRDEDRRHFIERHPGEFKYLKTTFQKRKEVLVYHDDGYTKSLALSPPNPRRGVVFIDPSYEIKTEYEDVATFIQKLYKKWPVAVIVLWYPVLTDNRHDTMADILRKTPFPKTWENLIRFPPMAHHRLSGSGLFIINMPFGITDKIDAALKAIIPPDVSQ